MVLRGLGSRTGRDVVSGVQPRGEVAFRNENAAPDAGSDRADAARPIVFQGSDRAVRSSGDLGHSQEVAKDWGRGVGVHGQERKTKTALASSVYFGIKHIRSRGTRFVVQFQRMTTNRCE
jgi:hypothetical protein